MIEILDKINNIYKKVPFLEYAIHPLNGEVTDLKELENDYIGCGKILTGVIFKEDGSTIVLYEKVEVKK